MICFFFYKMARSQWLRLSSSGLDQFGSVRFGPWVRCGWGKCFSIKAEDGHQQWSLVWCYIWVKSQASMFNRHAYFIYCCKRSTGMWKTVDTYFKCWHIIFSSISSHTFLAPTWNRGWLIACWQPFTITPAYFGTERCAFAPRFNLSAPWQRQIDVAWSGWKKG